MPQIPYSAVPEVRNSDPSGQQYNLHVTPEMFGLGVAKAMGELGGNLDRLGGVAAKHAVEFQTQQNQLDANDLTIKHMERLAQERAILEQKSGLDAVNYIPEYNKRVNQIYQDAAAASPNKATALLVQQEMRRQTGYAVMNGSLYAGRQQSQAADAARGARLGAAVNAAGGAEDLGMFDKQLEDVKKLARESSPGQEVETLNQAEQNAVDQAFTSKIGALTLNNPQAAQAYLDHSKGKVSAQAFTKMQAAVQASWNTVGAHQAAGMFTGGAMPAGTGMDAVWKGESGGNYNRLVNRKGVNKVIEADLTNMTVAEVMQLGREMTTERKSGDPNAHPSSAVGKYQILADTTLHDIVDAGVLSKDQKFDAQAQDKAAAWLFNRRIAAGGGDLAATMRELGKEWQIIQVDPKVAAGVEAWLRQSGMNKIALSSLDANTPQEQIDASISSARTYAARVQPDNPGFADALEQSIRNRVNVKKADDRVAEQQANNSLLLKALGGPNLDGPRPKSVMDLIGNDPNAQTWWNRLSATEKANISNIIDHGYARTDVKPTPETAQRYAAIIGMSLDEDKQEEFKNLKIFNEKLPLSQLQSLAVMQQRVLASREKQAEKNEDSITIGKVERQMEANGVFQSTGLTKGSEKRNIFRGQLYLELQNWKQENPGQKMKPEDVNEIASRIISTTPGRFWGHNSTWKEPEYGKIPPNAVIEITDTFKKKFGRPPTQAQIKEIYNNPRLYAAPPNNAGAATSEDDE